MSSLSLVFVPFLKIGRQGKEKKKGEDEEGGGGGGVELGEAGGVTRSNSQSSLWSSASARFYTGRWGDGCVEGSGSEAWGLGWGQAEGKWNGLETFEVCLKCGLERVVVTVQQLPVQQNDPSGSSAGSVHEVPSEHQHSDIRTGEAAWSGKAPNIRS